MTAISKLSNSIYTRMDLLDWLIQQVRTTLERIDTLELTEMSTVRMPDYLIPSIKLEIKYTSKIVINNWPMTLFRKNLHFLQFGCSI